MGTMATSHREALRDPMAAQTSRHASSLELLSDFERCASEILSCELALAESDPFELEQISARFTCTLERVITHLDALERLHSEGEPEEVEPDFSPKTMVTDLHASHPMLGDICFIGRLELGQANQALGASGPPDHRLVALESVQRKLGRIFTAVLDAARLLEDKVSDVDRRRKNDLECGISVRRVYSCFRRTLRRPADATLEATIMALRYCGFALVTLFAAPEFEKARVSDRRLLRHLHRRMLAWAQGEREPATGREILEDVHTSAHLLKGINRRQELREHDRRCLDELKAEPKLLGAERLSALLGLDDALDQLIESGSRGPEWVEAVQERLGSLERSMS